MATEFDLVDDSVAPIPLTPAVEPTAAGVASTAAPIGRDFKVDPLTGDLAFEAGAFSMVYGSEAIVQAVRVHLQFFLGEWFLDANVGVPYFQQVLVKNPSLGAIRQVFWEAIEEVPGIAKIERLLLNYDAGARSLLVTFAAISDTGELVAKALDLKVAV